MGTRAAFVGYAAQLQLHGTYKEVLLLRLLLLILLLLVLLFLVGGAAFI